MKHHEPASIIECPFCGDGTIGNPFHIKVTCQFCGREFTNWGRFKSRPAKKATITHEMVAAAIARFEKKGRKIKKLQTVTPAKRNFAFPTTFGQVEYRAMPDLTVEA